MLSSLKALVVGPRRQGHNVIELRINELHHDLNADNVVVPREVKGTL
jgi:hypothetical protein